MGVFAALECYQWLAVDARVESLRLGQTGFREAGRSSLLPHDVYGFRVFIGTRARLPVFKSLRTANSGCTQIYPKLGNRTLGPCKYAALVVRTCGWKQQARAVGKRLGDGISSRTAG